MVVVVKIEGVDRVLRALEHEAKKRFESPNAIKGSVIVGYTANYALYVHEDMEARHAPGKQAKYLEQPARELNNSGKLGATIRTALAGGAKMEQALAIAGLKIQRASQQIVPVSGWDEKISPPRQGSGNLKGSAFTRKE